MSSEVDEFDLDIRIQATHDERFLRPRPQHEWARSAGRDTEDTCDETPVNLRVRLPNPNLPGGHVRM